MGETVPVRSSVISRAAQRVRGWIGRNKAEDYETQPVATPRVDEREDVARRSEEVLARLGGKDSERGSRFEKVVTAAVGYDPVYGYDSIKALLPFMETTEWANRGQGQRPTVEQKKGQLLDMCSHIWSNLTGLERAHPQMRPIVYIVSNGASSEPTSPMISQHTKTSERVIMGPVLITDRSTHSRVVVNDYKDGIPDPDVDRALKAIFPSSGHESFRDRGSISQAFRSEAHKESNRDLVTEGLVVFDTNIKGLYIAKQQGIEALVIAKNSADLNRIGLIRNKTQAHLSHATGNVM